MDPEYLTQRGKVMRYLKDGSTLTAVQIASLTGLHLDVVCGILVSESDRQGGPVQTFKYHQPYDGQHVGWSLLEYSPRHAH